MNPHGNKALASLNESGTGWQLIGAALIVFAAGFWAYAGAMQNGFVWDSPLYLFPYEQRLSSLTLENIAWMLTSLEEANWHPLTWLSWAIDYWAYGGFEPAGFHLTNVLIHCANGVLVFFGLLAVFGMHASAATGWLSRNDARSVLAALVGSVAFVLHPQHVESVAWVAERKDVLCLFFMLTALLAYFNYAVAPLARRRGWYTLAVLLAVLAAMSKPMAVSLPVILLLMDVYPLNRLHGSEVSGRWLRGLMSLVVEKIPFVLISLALSWVTLIAQEEAMMSVPLAVRALNAFESYFGYISKWLFPIIFSPHYPYIMIADPSIGLRELVPVLGFAAITTVVVHLWIKGKRAWLVAWLFYVVTLVPMIGLISVGQQGMADRYAYLPTLPFYAIAAAGVRHLLRRGASLRVATIAIASTFCIFLGVSTVRQVRAWQSDLTLWNHAVMVNPEDGKSRINLGISLIQLGAFEQALAQFNAFDHLPLTKTRMYAWRAYTLLELTRLEEALADHLQMEKSSPGDPDAIIDWNCYNFNLGWIHAQMGRKGQSVEHFSRVAGHSYLAGSAQAWLAHLAADQSAVELGQGESELPGFCPALIPEHWEIPER